MKGIYQTSNVSCATMFSLLSFSWSLKRPNNKWMKTNMGSLFVSSTFLLVLFAQNLELVLGQNINFVLVVEGRKYGLAEQFTTHFNQVENEYKQ